MKLALLSNVNIDLLKDHLERQISPLEKVEIYLGGYGQVIQELLNRESQLYKFHPDFLFIFIDGDELFLDILDSYHDEASELIKNRVNEVVTAISTFVLEIKSYILLNSLVISPYSITPYMNTVSIIEHIASEELMRRTKELSNFVIVDWQKYVKKHGYVQLYDPRYWYLGRMTLSREGMERLAYIYSGYLRAIKGKSKKVLILDLDNTLWGGIVGEDGVQGIKLGEDGIGKAYRDLQKSIKALKEQGILLAIVSKNNLTDVEEAFKENTMMVLKLNDFVSLKVNWSDKAQNIKDLAEELNLGLDSFVFIDDSDFEREMVKEFLPDVTVPDFPSDPSFIPRWFNELIEECFPMIGVTSEDRKRTEMYQAEVKRSILRKESTNVEEFLSSLDMKVIIGVDDERHTNRIAQLTQRTNQFNLTTRRYTEEDISRFVKGPGSIVFDFELEDRFGISGVTGVIIVNLKDGTAYIDTFLMSCRIIGRRVEKAFLAYVINHLKSKGIKKLIGEYISAKKNGLVSDLYENMGFRKHESDKVHTMWELDITCYLIQPPEYIEVVGRSNGK